MTRLALAVCIATMLSLTYALTCPAQTVPSHVRSQIRAKAQAEWPDDYNMQAFTIKQQVEAYKKLQGKGT